ncbi:MAG: trans-sulfuration enzyme family protein [Acidimicrobiales bacterium]
MAGPDHVSQDTIAVRAGRADNGGALAPVVWASSTFEMASLEDARRQAMRPRATRFYGRHGNPSVRAFEDAVAALEGAEAAMAFASGMGAFCAVVLGLCNQGSHIVAQRQCYGGSTQLLAGVCPRFGIDVTFVDATEPGAFAAAVQPGRTMLLLAETPANPRLDLVDLDEIAAITGPIKMVDSTVATPLGQQPLAHGIDLVLHSATKSMAGHNDAVLGVVAGARDLIEWIWGFAVLQGATASPYDATNALRGLRTLGVRLRQQSTTATELARVLEHHSAVSEVRHPSLASHPRFELAQRQLRITGGLLSFELTGGLAAGERFMHEVQLCLAATSFGGPETLVTHPASTTHAGLTEEEMVQSGIGPGTIRVSCGLEGTEDVVADVIGALDRLSQPG